MTRPIDDPKVAQAFEALPEQARAAALSVRDLIVETASRTEGVGALQETLKWGQPAYLTPETKSGSTIRIGASKQADFAIFTHCQTTIMSEFQDLFPHDFAYEGNRAIHFRADEDVPREKLELLIRRALTYHQKPQK